MGGFRLFHGRFGVLGIGVMDEAERECHRLSKELLAVEIEVMIGNGWRQFGFRCITG